MKMTESEKANLNIDFNKLKEQEQNQFTYLFIGGNLSCKEVGMLTFFCQYRNPCYLPKKQIIGAFSDGETSIRNCLEILKEKKYIEFIVYRDPETKKYKKGVWGLTARSCDIAGIEYTQGDPDEQN